MRSNIKIALVSPPQNHLTDPLRAEPLGLMYIEEVLHHLGMDATLVDMSFESELPEADVYGFSASTVNYPQVVKYAEEVRPAFTILGGPHASALPEEALQHFDAVVVGPGETAIELLFCQQTRLTKGIYRCSPPDVNFIPMPRRPILNKIHYKSFEDGERTASIITSRGCPFQCSFCASNCIWGRKVQFRRVYDVIEEIEYLRDTYGIRCFKFVDDIFTLDKERFTQFSTALGGLNVRWFCEARVDSLDDTVLEQMAAAGCTTVNLGVESVDDSVLQKIQKRQTVEMARRAIQKIHSYGLKAKVYLIYGLPFEPADIVEKTIRFILEENPDYVSLFTITPYPGTDIWDHPEKYNVRSIQPEFEKYQHSVGEKEEELGWLPSIEYHDRTREQMRDERNELKRFTLFWNEAKAKERGVYDRVE